MLLVYPCILQNYYKKKKKKKTCANQPEILCIHQTVAISDNAQSSSTKTCLPTPTPHTHAHLDVPIRKASKGLSISSTTILLTAELWTVRLCSRHICLRSNITYNVGFTTLDFVGKSVSHRNALYYYYYRTFLGTVKQINYFNLYISSTKMNQSNKAKSFVSIWSESDAGPRARVNLGGDWPRVTKLPHHHGAIHTASQIWAGVGEYNAIVQVWLCLCC